MSNSPARSGIDVGSVIDGMYTIEALIGRGGMGAVFLATHRRLAGKKVAIKMLLADLEGDEILARFKREADIASTLDHPNIVKVENYNVLPDGTPYIAYEFLQGESLGQRLAAGAMPTDQIFAIMRGVGSALVAAHRAGVVHRDLKPQNIFLVQTEVTGDALELAKVLDFGISKLRGSTTVKTQDSTLLGTPQYMAPEQATGQHSAVDERTDIFALGAILYEMVTGRPAFNGASIPEVVFKVVYEEPAPLDASVPPHIANAIAKAMAKAPADRFATVAQLVEALTGQPLSLTHKSVPPRQSSTERGTTDEHIKKSSANEAFAQTVGSGDHGPVPSMLDKTALPPDSGNRPNAVGAASASASAVSATGATSYAPGERKVPSVVAPPAPAPTPAPAATTVADKKRSPLLVPLIVLGVAAVAAGGVYVAMRKPPATPQQSTPPPPPVAVVAIDAGAPAIMPPPPPVPVDAAAVVVAPPTPVDAAIAATLPPPHNNAGKHPPPPPETPETGDPDMEVRLHDAETALRDKDASRAEQLANLVITSDAAGKGQRAHAHVIHGISQCTLRRSEEGAQIDLRQVAGFGALRHRLVTACKSEGFLQTVGD